MSSQIDELGKLAQLKASGAISDAEYETLKAKYMTQIGSPTPTQGATSMPPEMSFGQAISSCFGKYVTFAGRARRSEYWFWVLFLLLGQIAATIIDAVLGTNGVFAGLFILATLLPGLSVLVRRLHDTDRSGWWYWIILVPLVGIILVIVWFCTKGTTGDNRFGPDPLAAAA